MNKTELQQKIVDMEKQLSELKKELEKRDKGIWKPELCDEYCYVDSDAEIVWDNNNKCKVDEDRINFGNYFKTEQEATKMANYLKYTNLLRKYVEEHSEPLDWEDKQKEKYHIFYSNNYKEIQYGQNCAIRSQGTIYASSEEVLKEAIEFLGEENIKKYIFGIEE